MVPYDLSKINGIWHSFPPRNQLPGSPRKRAHEEVVTQQQMDPSPLAGGTLQENKAPFSQGSFSPYEIIQEHPFPFSQSSSSQSEIFQKNFLQHSQNNHSMVDNPTYPNNPSTNETNFYRPPTNQNVEQEGSGDTNLSHFETSNGPLIDDQGGVENTKPKYVGEKVPIQKQAKKKQRPARYTNCDYDHYKETDENGEEIWRCPKHKKSLFTQNGISLTTSEATKIAKILFRNCPLGPSGKGLAAAIMTTIFTRSSTKK